MLIETGVFLFCLFGRPTWRFNCLCLQLRNFFRISTNVGTIKSSIVRRLHLEMKANMDGESREQENNLG